MAGRPAPEPITEPFAELMAEAARAYLMDCSLAEAMASAAMRIHYKRDTWAARLELRNAAATAVATCARLPTFTCTSPSPCGVGRECRVAAGDLALLDVTSTTPGKELRPQPHSDGPTFSVESAVRRLAEMRAATRRIA